MYACFVCNSNFETVKLLCLHLRYKHMIPSNNIYTCVQDNCPQRFTNIKAYKRHLLRCHEQRDMVNNANVGLSNQVLESEVSRRSSNEDNVEKTIYDPRISAEIENDIENIVLKFVSNLNSLSHMTNKQIEGIFSEVGNIIEFILEKLKENISKKISIDDDHDLSGIFDHSLKIFQKCSTEYLLIKHLTQRDLMMQPTEFVVDNQVAEVMKKGVPLLEGRSLKGTIMPIEYQIKKFFELPNMLKNSLKHLEDLRSSENSILSNFVQGSYWNDKISSMLGKTIIPFFLNYDDFETNDPVGCHTGSQSISAFYYCFPMFPPQSFSKLSHIFPAMFVKASYLKTVDPDKILYPLVEIIRKLEIDGIELHTDEGKMQVHFVLGLVLGDNLGLNTILGFSKSFSHTYFCRFCCQSKNETQKSNKEIGYYMRTKEQYDQHIVTNDYSQTGVRTESIFNTIPSFHVIENYAVDIMHDVFEGVIKYGVLNALKYFISNNYFSLTTFNYRVQNFHYGEIEVRNKCQVIKDQHLKNNKLHVTAREALNMIHFFTCFVGDLVKKGDKVWKYICLLETLVNLLLSMTFSENEIILLEEYILKHHKMYTHLFKDTLKPKHHLLVHYPNIVRKSGPLRFLWCMRFESKNREMVNYTNATSSRRNLPLSIGKKCAMKFSNLLLSFVSYREYTILKQEKSLLSEKEYYHLLFKDTLCKDDDNIVISSHITYKGTVYKAGYYMFNGSFYEIVDIVIFTEENSIYLILNDVKVTEKDEHFNCYFIIESTKNITCKIIESFNIKPTVLHILPDGRKFLKTRNL